MVRCIEHGLHDGIWNRRAFTVGERMVSGITVSEQRRYAEYAEAVFEAYMRVNDFLNYPSPMNIYGEYCAMVDRAVIDLQAREYPDEFYDGSPGKSSKRILPDYIIGSLSDYIGMPADVSLDIIRIVLEDHQLFYVEGEYFNSPLKEVW